MPTPTARVMNPELRGLVTTIADEFGGKPAAYAARPYIDALIEVEDGDSRYYEDSVHTLVTYLKSNLGAWRGPVAAQVKQRLAELLREQTAVVA